MKLLKNVKPMDLVRCNNIWNNLLFSNFSNEKVVKQFDSLISESDTPEKDGRRAR